MVLQSVAFPVPPGFENTLHDRRQYFWICLKDEFGRSIEGAAVFRRQWIIRTAQHMNGTTQIKSAATWTGDLPHASIPQCDRREGANAAENNYEQPSEVENITKN